MESFNRFEGVLYGMSDEIKEMLLKIPRPVKTVCDEIRLRAGAPICLTRGKDTLFIGNDGLTSLKDCSLLPRITKAQLEECFSRLVGNSAFAHADELGEGYISMKNGCRAGVCGRLTESGFMQDITSINIRIAREVKGAADKITDGYNGESILIAGPPGCGKTTVLRDTIRQLAGGNLGKYYRISLIDCRGEVSGGYGNRVNDLGVTTDILYTTDKAKGIEISLRTMFPEIIAFDEIGTETELKRVRESFFAGVSVITTAHIGNENELFERSVTRELLRSGMIESIFILPKNHNGEIKNVNFEELQNNYAC